MLAANECIKFSLTCLFTLQDLKSKRNPRLVPYVLLDERTKKSNRDSLREAIRTLIGYGYNIEPSDQEGGEFDSYKHSNDTVGNCNKEWEQML